MNSYAITASDLGFLRLHVPDSQLQERFANASKVVDRSTIERFNLELTEDEASSLVESLLGVLTDRGVDEKGEINQFGSNLDDFIGMFTQD